MARVTNGLPAVPRKEAYSLAEVWTWNGDNEERRRKALFAFADAVDDIAGRQNSTELTCWEVLHALHMPNITTLRTLPGFPAYRRNGVWFMNNREFRKWATQGQEPPRPAVIQESLL